MKIACFTAMAPDIRLEDLFPLAAKIGYSGLEVAAGYPNALYGEKQWHIDIERLKQETERLKSLAKNNSLRIIGIASTPQPISAQKHLIDFAVSLGCEFIRIGCVLYDSQAGYSNLLKKMRGTLAELCTHVASKSLKLLVETHPGNIIPSASLASTLMDGFDHKQIGIIWDPGNQVMEGYEQTPLAIDLLGEYLAHVHVKNLFWKYSDSRWHCDYASLSKGLVDWKKTYGLLVSRGYEGWFSVEDFRGGYCCRPVGITTEQKLREDLKFFKNLEHNLLK